VAEHNGAPVGRSGNARLTLQGARRYPVAVMTPGKPLVSAIVVNWNTRDQLLDCLRAYYACSDVPAEAVVVDNASMDGSVEAVAREFPEAKVIRQRSNVGFGRANNAGLQVAEGRFILLMSPDVTVMPGSVGRLADFLLVRPDAGAVGPRLQRPDGLLDETARRGFPSPGATLFHYTGLGKVFPHNERLNRFSMGHLPATETHEIDAGTAACMMVRRAAIDRVGFFDPDYFMFGEDLDLCYRLKSSGWKVFYLPTARAVHARAAASKQESSRMLLELHRSMWTFHHKHYAADLPAFANGLVWAGIWARWAVKAATSSNGQSAQHAAPRQGGYPPYQGGYAQDDAYPRDGGYQGYPQDGAYPQDGGYPQNGGYHVPPQQGAGYPPDDGYEEPEPPRGYPPRGGYSGSS
jgi:GT2 family glycosyltransferase